MIMEHKYILLLIQKFVTSHNQFAAEAHVTAGVYLRPLYRSWCHV